MFPSMLVHKEEWNEGMNELYKKSNLKRQKEEMKSLSWYVGRRREEERKEERRKTRGIQDSLWKNLGAFWSSLRSSIRANLPSAAVFYWTTCDH